MRRPRYTVSTCLVTPDDPDFLGHVACCKAKQSNGPAVSSPNYAVPNFLIRQPVGPSVEQAARLILGQFHQLDDRRIVKSLLTDRNGVTRAHFKECDGVVFLSKSRLLVFETKTLGTKYMRELYGCEQVKATADFLRRRYRTVLTRLVYVSPESAPIRSDLPTVEIDDVTSAQGVVWITPNQVEEAAALLGLYLPQDWNDHDGRYSGMPFAA